MTEIYQDNLDVTAIIGGDKTGRDEYSQRLENMRNDDTDVNEWEIVEAEVVLTHRSTPNYVDMIIVPGEETDYPAIPQRRPGEDGAVDRSIDGMLGKTFTLDVDTDIRATTPGPEVTRLFTGNIANMTPMGDGSFEAIANDRTQEPFLDDETGAGRDIQNDTIVIARPTAGPGGTISNVGDRSLRVSEIIEKICEKLDIPQDERHINVERGGKNVGETPNGETILKGFDAKIEFEAWVINIQDALTRAEEASNAYWWFDRYGEFHFGPLIPDEDIRSYEMQFITDSSAGLTTPPYRSVKVIGDGVASEEGWTRSSMISESKYTTGGNVYVDEDSAELAEPTFVYRNMEISTASEADNVRNKIVDKLRKQRASGTITLVGFPELYPNDAVQMPNDESQPMGGERYGVNSVTHRLNSSDGFITKVEVEGLDRNQDVLYDNTLKEDQAGTIRDLRESAETLISSPFFD